MPESPSELHAMSTQCIGGLGDVGRVLAQWMVSRGARELVIMSRSTRRVEREQSFIKELEAQNCQIITVAGDVTNLEDVKAAVSSCTKPLAGEINLALSLQDRILLHMTHAEWKSALTPKVSGTWNLHRAVEGQPLDFFLVLSSLVGITGHAGQANYSAVCTYLDAFTQYRRQMGLLSSVFDIGPVAGSAAIEDQAVSRQLDTAGWTRLSKQQLIASVQLAISDELIIGFFRSLSETGYTKMLEDDIYGRDARLSMYQNLVARADNRKPDNQIKLLFERVEKDSRLFSDPGTQTILVLELAKLINHRTSQLSEMDLGQAQAVAVDSLMAIEVKSWLSRQLGLHVTVDEITKANTVGSLVHIIVQRAKAKYRADDNGTASTKES
ncbi:KR domain-containing protein [Aspergillus pseudonomiae]|uniref:KR domain-containing protein n=1 Tax=Aspergillus pseudonomiae TaxID=1506151 RepID=A0A5N7CVU9_9EURO|nr:KR domain-containing protein [Aspergillus pseudonomiae]KAE8398271.1 KR domain-containing protein [Aspergillus pseudonomiae]